MWRKLKVEFESQALLKRTCCLVCIVLSSCSSPKSVCGVHVCCSFIFLSIWLFVVFVWSHPQLIQSIKYLHIHTDGRGFCLPAHRGETSDSYVPFFCCQSTLCSQQGLWVILSNPVMISGIKQRYIAEIYIYIIYLESQVECSLVILYLK